MIVYQQHDSPLGPLLLGADARALRHIDFARDGCAAEPAAGWQAGDHPVLRDARRQLDAYFAGRLQQFDLPLAPNGTAFQQQVWRALQTIPFGQTRSYAQIAASVGRARAARAVGAANGKNPLPVVIPCHRVIGSDGSLTGFAGGLALKSFLLRHEGAPFAAFSSG